MWSQISRIFFESFWRKFLCVRNLTEAIMPVNADKGRLTESKHVSKHLSAHLVHESNIYNETYNVSFHQKLMSIHYNAALAIIEALRGTSREKLCRD